MIIEEVRIPAADSPTSLAQNYTSYEICRLNFSIVFYLELMSDNKVFRAVVSHGVAQWFSIGLEMGLMGPEIEACTFDKPALGSKLQATIELKI